MKPPIPFHRGHAPFAPLLIALASGIIVSYCWLPSRQGYVVAVALWVLSLAAFLYVIVKTRLRKQRYYAFAGFCVLSILFFGGMLSAWRTHPEVNTAHFSNGQYRALAGYVADEPITRNGTIRFPMAVTHAYGQGGCEVSGNLMVTVRWPDSLSSSPFMYGDEVVIPARFSEVPPPYNPGEFNYRRYLANKNTWHQAFLSSEEIHKLGKGAGNLFVYIALKWRHRFVRKFKQFMHDGEARAVASTLILGDRAELNDDLLQTYSKTGTIHVLSVSGMHVVLVFWICSQLMRWTNQRRRLRVVRCVVLLTAVWVYAAITGFSPSVLRASLMISFIIAATVFNQENRIGNSVCASAFFLLLYNPKFIADIGFQLSYLAVLGIVALAPIGRILSTRRIISPVTSYLWMSVSAQAGAGPMAAYYFHQFPFYFLLANLFIVLPASAVMYLGFALLMIPVGTVAAWTGYLLENAIIFIHQVLHYIEQLPAATVNGIWMDSWDCLMIYMLMGFFAIGFQYRSKVCIYAGLFLMALFPIRSVISRYRLGPQKTYIVFNVGRNLAMGLIGRGEAWLYSNAYSLEDRWVRYSVTPRLEQSAPADRIHFIPEGGCYTNGGVYVKDQIIQFGNTRLMVYDEKKTYSGHLDVDVLLIRNNPRSSLAQILTTIRCRSLLIDGSNYPGTIKRFAAEASEEGVPFYVLKDNFAYQSRVL